MASNVGPLAELRDDPLGARLEHPPQRAFIPQPRRAEDRPQVVGVPDYEVAVAQLHGFRTIAGMDLEQQGINVEPVLGWHG